MPRLTHRQKAAAEQQRQLTRRQREVVKHLEANPNAYFWHTDSQGEPMAVCTVGDLQIKREPTLRVMVEKGALVCMNPDDMGGEDWKYALPPKRRAFPLVTAEAGLLKITFLESPWPPRYFEMAEKGLSELVQALIEHRAAGGELNAQCSSSTDFPEEHGFSEHVDIPAFLNKAFTLVRQADAAGDEGVFCLCQIRGLRKQSVQEGEGNSGYYFQVRFGSDDNWKGIYSGKEPQIVDP